MGGVSGGPEREHVPHSHATGDLVFTQCYEGQEIGPIALSMGVSAYPASGTRPEELLRVADAALYRAKQAGRDRFVSAVA